MQNRTFGFGKFFIILPLITFTFSGTFLPISATAPTLDAVPVPRITQLEISGRKLIVTGENFISGAKILINGEAQRTRYESTTTLIGKKAGKNLKIGDSVQVRNPDGLVSPEFRYGIAVPYSIPLKANDVVYSPAKDRIYASVGSGASQFADTVAVIDPLLGRVESSIPVGRQPKKLALSDDSRYLYVEIDGLKVQRVDINASRVDLEFSVELVSGDCFRFIGDMQVMPGSPGTIALSVFCGQSSVVVAVFDNGVRRPAVVSSGIWPVQLCFAAPDTLWGYNTSTTRFELSKLSVDQQGVTHVGIPAESLLYAGVDLKFHNGLIYTTNGRVVDPEKRTFDGRFLGREVLSAASFDLDISSDRAYFAQREGFELTLAAYEIGTYRILEYYRAYYGAAGYVIRMIRCGNAGLAILTELPEPAVVIYPLSLLKPVPAYERPQPMPISSSVRRIPLPNYSLALDASRVKFYASVPSWVGGIGNSIVAVDPLAGTVGDPVWVGSEPWQLTVSDGGQYLYAALFGGRAIRRLQLPELTADLRFSLFVHKMFDRAPISTNVFDMLSLPGRADSVIVAKGDFHDHSAPESDGVSIYDNGVERPLSTPAWPSGLPSIDMLQLSSSGAGLYGLNTHISDFTFTRMALLADGVRVVASQSDLGDSGVTSFKCENNLCFTNTGLIIDAEAQKRIGRFIFEAILAFPVQVIPDLQRSRVYFVGSSQAGVYAYAFDVNTMREIARFRILNEGKPVLSFHLWNNDQFALSTGDEIIFFPMSLLAAP